MGLIGTKRSDERAERAGAAATSATISRARDRAHRLDDASLSMWAESVAMNLQAQITHFMVSRDVTCLHEAVVLNDSLRGILAEAIERNP